MALLCNTLSVNSVAAPDNWAEACSVVWLVRNRVIGLGVGKVILSQRDHILKLPGPQGPTAALLVFILSCPLIRD